MYSDKSFTLATSNDQFLIIDGTRVNDVRVYEDGIDQSRWARWNLQVASTSASVVASALTNAGGVSWRASRMMDSHPWRISRVSLAIE